MGKFKPAEKLQTTPAGNTTRTEARVKPGAGRIAQIVFLNGANSAEQGNVKQYVNVDPSAELVDGVTVPNIARLGHKPQLEVRFNRPGNFEFTVECEPVNGNANYTEGELSRNPRFGYQKEKKTYKTDGNGCLALPLDDFFVGAAGKDKYIFRATDANGVSVSTGILETYRLIYYVELKMRSLTSCAPNLSIVEAEYAKYNIALQKLPSVEMEHMPNIRSKHERQEFKLRVRASYDQSSAVEKQPYVVAIAYTDHLAEKLPSQPVTKLSVNVGPGNPPVDIPIMIEDPLTQVVERYCLWQNLVPGEGWFVSCEFIPQGSSGLGAINISADKCTAMLGDTPSQTKANSVQVDVSQLPPGLGTIELSVNVVGSMFAGMAFTRGNVICVCTRSWWSTVDAAQQNRIIIHELGHMIGLTSDGSGKLPDKIPTFYDESQGHVGSHCHFGLSSTLPSYDIDEAKSKSKCVMFGANNGRASFCVNCDPVVRKVDISDGWEAF